MDVLSVARVTQSILSLVFTIIACHPDVKSRVISVKAVTGQRQRVKPPVGPSWSVTNDYRRRRQTTDDDRRRATVTYCVGGLFKSRVLQLFALRGMPQEVTSCQISESDLIVVFRSAVSIRHGTFISIVRK